MRNAGERINKGEIEAPRKKEKMAKNKSLDYLIYPLIKRENEIHSE